MKESIEREKKWRWKMEYCKKQHIPPAHSWAWDEAEKAYNLREAVKKTETK